uniref:Uncharacterized protein n=1 Tax=Tanacetum cinerariifolium TaxID=118510 RepID=A0A6L2LUL4_TANCI|nr:hypothetical protein [Tanacetum cinerariifolium]
MALSGSLFLIFDVHYDSTFKFMPLSYENCLVYHWSVRKDNDLDLATARDFLREETKFIILYELFFKLPQCELDDVDLKITKNEMDSVAMYDHADSYGKIHVYITHGPQDLAPFMLRTSIIAHAGKMSVEELVGLTSKACDDDISVTSVVYKGEGLVDKGKWKMVDEGNAVKSKKSVRSRNSGSMDDDSDSDIDMEQMYKGNADLKEMYKGNTDFESEYFDKSVDYLSKGEDELISLRKRNIAAKKNPNLSKKSINTQEAGCSRSNRVYDVGESDTVIHHEEYIDKLMGELRDVGDGLTYPSSKDQVIARCGFRPEKLKDNKKGKQRKTGKYPSAGRDELSNCQFRCYGKTMVTEKSFQFGIKIMQNSEIKLHEIADLVMKKYKCIVNPIQCRNAKKFALNEGETTTEDHYAMIWSYGKAILESNDGSTVKLVGKDGNNHMYPIAWAIINVDNKDNWSWFLQLHGEDIDMPTRNGLTLISYQHKTGDICPNIQKRLELNKDKHRFWHVIRAGGNIFEVRNGSKAFRVDEQQRTCRCRMWQLTVGVETGTNMGSVGVATGTNVGSMGVETGTNAGSIGVETGTNVDSVGVESSAGNETVRSVSLGDFVSVRSKDTTTATRSRGRLGFKVRRGTSEGTQAAIRGRGGQTLGLGVRRGTSGSTSTGRRSRDGQTLWLRVRRGIGLRGGVAEGVRYGRLGRWFGLGDETQPNEKLTIETQQSHSGIQQELQADQEGRHAQAHINIQRGNHKLRPRSKRIKKQKIARSIDGIGSSNTNGLDLD